MKAGDCAGCSRPACSTFEYIDSRVAAGAAVLIAPKEPLEISRVCHDPDMMQRVYDIGREAGESALSRGCFCGYNMPHEKR